MKDPISDSKATVAMLKEHCDGVIIKELDAGNENFIYLFYFLYLIIRHHSRGFKLIFFFSLTLQAIVPMTRCQNQLILSFVVGYRRWKVTF
jgi:hypothetical protein